MASGRARNATVTRDDILAAARRCFGADGYERTTMRAVAADVGVDPALVYRYFGSKQQLFAAAANLQLHFPDLSAVAASDLAEVILPVFFRVWEHNGTFLALLRAAMTSPAAAQALTDAFTTQVLPALAVVAPDHQRERAGLVGAVVIGLATTRLVLATPGISDLTQMEITQWLGPVLEQILTASLPPA